MIKNITKVPFGVIYRGVVPFLAGLVLCAALLFLFPQLATLIRDAGIRQGRLESLAIESLNSFSGFPKI